jgi:hypothetical protein
MKCDWLPNAAVLLMLIAVLACIVYADAIYLPAPHYSSHADTGSPVRYSTPVEGFLVVDVTTSGVGDQTIDLDDQLAGYIERIVYSHNGNDASWSLTITDHEGVTLYADAAANAGADPVSRVVVIDDADGNGFGGPPFAGGLSIAIADADDGTGDAVTVRLYIREAWRR